MIAPAAASRPTFSWCAHTPYLLLGLLITVAGCRAPNTDLIEAELRTKERQLEEMKAELNKCECEVQSLESELEQFQKRHLKTAGQPAPVQMIVQNITLGRLTGGVDEDPDCPGDEALQIMLEPRDQDDQSIKAPGALHVAAFEVSPQGVKTLLSSWDVPARELRRKWESPVFGGSAYRVILRWQNPPTTEKLRVVVLFTTPDGRKFEADRDVSVRLPERPKRKRPKPDQKPKPQPDADSLTPHVCPEPEEELPQPRSVPPTRPVAPPADPNLERKPTGHVGAAAPAASAMSVSAPLPPAVEARPSALVPVTYRVPAAPEPSPPTNTIGLAAPPGARRTPRP